MSIRYSGQVVHWDTALHCGSVDIPELTRTIRVSAYDFGLKEQGPPEKGEWIDITLDDGNRNLLKASRRGFRGEQNMEDDVSPNAPRGRLIEMDVYRVMSNSDLTEGKGKEFVLATYQNRLDAQRHGAGNYVMGSACPIVQERVKVVKLQDDTYFELGSEVLRGFVDKNELRLRALAKLTPEERELLGLAPSYK